MRRVSIIGLVLATSFAVLALAPAAAQAPGPLPCAATSIADTAEGGRLDVLRLTAEWQCSGDQLIFTIGTADAFTRADVGEVAIILDTDGDPGNGCAEGDMLLYGVNPPDDGVDDILGSLYDYSDCEITNEDRLDGVAWTLTGDRSLQVVAPRAGLGGPDRIAVYATLEATGEERSEADFAPDAGNLVLDTRALDDPGSVGFCLDDPTGDVLRRESGGSDTEIAAPEFDVTRACTYWGTSLAVHLTIPELDVRAVGSGASVTALVNLEGDSQAERVLIATWDGLAWSVAVNDADGDAIPGCGGRVLVTGGMITVGEVDPDCLGDGESVGVSAGWGRSDGQGGITFDRAGPGTYSVLRRAQPLDAADVGERPDPSAVASPADAPQADAVQRLAGAARVETSVAISRDAWPDGAAAAVLARQDVEADALAGAALAAAVGGPLLLTRSSQVPDAVAIELLRLLEPGARVYILGGPLALDDQVLVDVQQLGFGAQRLAGEDRFGTAAAIAGEAATFLDGVEHILIADGIEFQWALIAGAAAGANQGVVLTTVSGGLSPEAQAFVNAHPEATITAVGPRATTAAPDARPIDGAGDPYRTSVLVAEEFFAEGAPLNVVVASGESFPDGLGGGAFAASLGGPLLLSPQGDLPAPVSSYLSNTGVDDAHLLGGPVALSDQVEASLRALVS